MSEILKRIREDLKRAMISEVQARKFLDKYPPIMGSTNEQMAVVMKLSDTQKSVSRAIISMYPEIGVKPDKATDEDTIKLIKKYISMEKTRELYVQKYLTEKDVEGLNSTQVNTLVIKKFHELGDNLTSPKIKLAREYLPKEPNETEIIQWIKDHIDFSKLKNKMQAMKFIMDEFKGLDGNKAKKILTENF